ncbi:armadillo-type protein [Mycena metata]|uniref:Armadillo-type protein n=1 Tax=Mycena metata TaxID=1033252 RepID=A0AAD7IJE7_9AGAR|nr:armadillo-type protein [Mycena metata]
MSLAQHVPLRTPHQRRCVYHPNAKPHLQVSAKTAIYGSKMFAEHPSAKMRCHAIACLSYFVPVGSQSLFVHLDTFIATLSKLAPDNDPSVRRHVCQALVLLLAAHPEMLMPEMVNVAEYMLYSTKDKNENVALEACEFWLTFAEDTNLAGHLHPLLGKVAFDCMIYGEDDLLWLERDTEDAAVPDKDTDIKQRTMAAASPPEMRIGAYGEETIDSDEEDDCDLDDEDFTDEMSTEWNLRKCVPAAPDGFAVRFSGDLLNVLLGPLKERRRESGIGGNTKVAQYMFYTVLKAITFDEKLRESQKSNSQGFKKGSPYWESNQKHKV